MNIITNEKLIKRNSIIAQVTNFTGIGILIVMLFVFFKFKDDPTIYNLSWWLVIAAFILTQVGLYYMNRWGRRPRPDEYLNMALKGLSSNYSLYHYRTPTSHLLVGPAGVWVLLPRYQRGKITYEKNRFRQRGGGPLMGYLRIFGQEGIGRQEIEAEMEISSINKLFKKKLGEDNLPEIKAALVFTSDKAEIEIEDAPVPVLPVKKLKEFIRKTAKGKVLSVDRIHTITAMLGGETKVQPDQGAEKEEEE